MNVRHLTIVWGTVMVLACLVAPLTLGQEPEAGSPAAEDSATAEPPVPTDPAVVAILATEPASPAECARAAKTLTDLGYPEVAKPLLKKVIDAKLNPEQLADLGEQFGSPMFLDMAVSAALLPEAKELADAVTAAVAARLTDPKRIAELIGQLQDPQAEKRVEALAGLQASGSAAIGPLIAVLADPSRTAEYANVRTVLAGMGRSAREALAAVLVGTDPKLAVQAILTLAEMDNRKTAIDLVGPCVSDSGDSDVRAAAATALKQLTGHMPTRSEAIGLLVETAKAYFNRRQPIEGVIDDRVELWRWDPTTRQCVVRTGEPDDAARALAARYAREAHALAPDDRGVRLLYLTTLLDEAAYAGGLDQTLDEQDPAVVEARRFGAQAIDDALEYAMDHHHPAAATVAAQLLGQVGTADELLYQGAKPSPLARALQQPDRRLRMAALEAIASLKPTKPFAGASYVPSALAFFAASSGVRHALVGGPNIEQARDLAGMLAAAGFQTDTAATGNEFLRLAMRSPDYELAWIDVSISRPDINTLMHTLRRDGRTASLRVGLMARSGHFDKAERLAERDPMAKPFARPHDDESFRWQLEQLSTLSPREFVGFDVRERQAAQSLELLAELSRSSSGLYDLRQTQDAVLAALYNPKLATRAVAVLANLNSAESQQALVDVASRVTQPLELRKAAVKAFRESTREHGVLLTTDQIRQQYDRYNQSRDQDAATQRVLGLILDCIEAPSAKRVGLQRAGVSTPDQSPAKNPVPQTLTPDP